MELSPGELGNEVEFHINLTAKTSSPQNEIKMAMSYTYPSAEYKSSESTNFADQKKKMKMLVKHIHIGIVIYFDKMQTYIKEFVITAGEINLK